MRLTVRIRAAVVLLVACGPAVADPIPARYRIVEGSTLTDDCPVCGRPTVTVPVRGSFWLHLTVQDSLFSNYVIRDLVIRSLGGELGYEGKGQGAYRIGGEVALLQRMTLEGSINEFDHLEFDSGQVPTQAPFSWIEIDLPQVSPVNPLRMFTLHLVAVPWPSLWFSTEVGFHASTGAIPVSEGDLLSPTGQVVRTNAQLTARLGIMPMVPDLGLDAVALVLPSRPPATKALEIWFSTLTDAVSTSLGPLGHGDLLSDAGTIVRHNAELVTPFLPQPPVPDFGLDAVSIGPDGALLFSIEESFFSQKLGVIIGDADLLSDNGRIVKTSAQLMAGFQPVEPVPKSFGLDAAYAWPWGEVWFSTGANFVDLKWGSVGKGDLLSDTGRVIARNRELMEVFGPLEDLADFGLDALHVLLPIQFDGCGVITYGPSNCLLFQADTGDLYVLDNLGDFRLGDRVHVTGIVNPDPGCAPGCLGASGCIEGNTIHSCIEACGVLVQGVECVLFQADRGGLYMLEYLNGFGVGDRVRVTGGWNPNCPTACQQGNSCIVNNTISASTPADFDCDCDVDLDDLAAFEACVSGPAVACAGDCARTDFDRDTDVDQSDFGIFQRCYSEANKPADPHCAPEGPQITGSRRSDCRPGHSTENGYPWCGKDELDIIAQGHSLQVTHRNAAYNCCLDSIQVTLNAQGPNLRFYETETLTTPCFCLCCYDTTTTVEGLTPGAYTIEYCWQDEESEYMCLTRDVMVLP
ncbi:MAG: hypothetical protein KA354_20205 [Phycisphaerae bacterium]|nr:hypothetical protein [Phycisphaerae bacterium]